MSLVYSTWGVCGILMEKARFANRENAFGSYFDSFYARFVNGILKTFKDPFIVLL